MTRLAGRLFVVYPLYPNEFLTLVKSDLEMAMNSIVSNKLPNRIGGKSNNPVVIGARDDVPRAALIVSQVLFG